MFAILLTAAAVQIFPVRAGTTWVYSARVQYVMADTNQTRSEIIRWTMRVVEVIRSEKGEAAIVQGFPLELAWYEKNQQPGYEVVFQNERGLFVARAKDLKEATEIVEQSPDKAAAEQILSFPVRVRACTGGEGDRTDTRYCWLVERAIKDTRGSGWEVLYRTAPDHTRIWFVRGVGVTRYIYEHHGTVSSVDARLVSMTP